MSIRREKGFTMIELVVIIAIMAVLTSIVVAFFYRLEGNKAMSADASLIVGVLTDAKARTLAGEGATSYGVHFDSGQAVLFSGTTYTSTDPTNIVTPLNSRDSVTTLVTGGGSEISFARLTGEVASSTITLTLISSPTTHRIITVSSLGTIELH